MKKSIFSTLALFLVILLCSAAGLPQEVRAQTNTPPAKQMPARGPNPPEIELSPIQANTPERSNVPDSAIGWVRMVYQTYKDQNWEIYLSRWSSGGEDNLTYNPAADFNPKINHHINKILFSSNRSGATSLYLMNMDGSAQARLIFSDHLNYSGSWSFDDSKIVFVSNRDGVNDQAAGEIYLMNADGSGQTRLTWSGLDNDSPAFSPDGSQIAWLRYNGAYASLWVMNVDSSNAHPVTEELLYLQDPAWSPDGAHIAVDYDADGDNWNEVVVMEINGSNRQIVCDFPQQVDAWMGSWLPNGWSMFVTRANYAYYNGFYYLEHSYIDYIELNSGSPINNYVGDGYSIKPDAQSLDIEPPVTKVDPLPEFSRMPFDITWSAYDIGVSGLPNSPYLLQYRIDKNPWEYLQCSPTYRISYPFANYYLTTGGLVYFRTSAIDDAGNNEPWPAEPGDAWTKTFMRLLTVSSRDSRGFIVPRASIGIAPSPWEIMTNTGITGDQTYHIRSNDLLSISLGHTGYNPAPGIKNMSEFDSSLTGYLLPGDNKILNAGFESGLTSWVSSGSLATTLAPGYDGEYAVSLGPARQAAGKQPQQVESNDYLTQKISQTVSLPPWMHEPTLAYQYKFINDVSEGGSYFEVSISSRVSETITTTTIYTNAANMEWTHQWFELDPWISQTITVTFQLYQAFYLPDAILLLDDVSIGSWLTPVPSSTYPSNFQTNWTSQVITITGENFISTPTVKFGSVSAAHVDYIDSQTLRVTLPVGIKPNIYDVWVINPGGQEGGVQRGLTLGLPHYLPVIMK